MMLFIKGSMEVNFINDDKNPRMRMLNFEEILTLPIPTTSIVLIEELHRAILINYLDKYANSYRYKQLINRLKEKNTDILLSPPKRNNANLCEIKEGSIVSITFITKLS